MRPGRHCPLTPYDRLCTAPNCRLARVHFGLFGVECQIDDMADEALDRFSAPRREFELCDRLSRGDDEARDILGGYVLVDELVVRRPPDSPGELRGHRLLAIQV